MKYLILLLVISLSSQSYSSDSKVTKSKPVIKKTPKAAVSYPIPPNRDQINSAKYKSTKLCLEAFGQRIDNLIRTSSILLNISLLTNILDDWEKRKSDPTSGISEENHIKPVKEMLLGQYKNLAPKKESDKKKSVLYVLDNENIKLLREVFGSLEVKNPTYNSAQTSRNFLNDNKNEISLYCSVAAERFSTQYQITDTQTCGEAYKKAHKLKKIPKSIAAEESLKSTDLLEQLQLLIDNKAIPLLHDGIANLNEVLKQKDAKPEDKKKAIKALLTKPELLNGIAATLHDRLSTIYSKKCHKTILTTDPAEETVVKDVICRSKVRLPKLPNIDIFEKLTEVFIQNPPPVVAVETKTDNYVSPGPLPQVVKDNFDFDFSIDCVKSKENEDQEQECTATISINDETEKSKISDHEKEISWYKNDKCEGDVITKGKKQKFKRESESYQVCAKVTINNVAKDDRAEISSPDKSYASDDEFVGPPLPSYRGGSLPQPPQFPSIPPLDIYVIPGGNQL